jgi:hypothetical protein
MIVMYRIQYLSVALICVGCQSRESAITSPSTTTQARPESKESANSSVDWTKSGSLPLLVRKRVRPLVNAADFADESLYFRYPREPNTPPPTEEPFDTDEDAIAAAVKWLVDQFGELPPDTSLQVTSLEHSSSGHSKAVFDWDRGHTITFEQRFNGIPTDSHTVIYITGRTQFSASVSLCSFDPVPESRKEIVDEGVAIKALRDVYENAKAGPEVLEQFDKKAHAKLEYLWSPKANQSSGLDEMNILAPTWVINGEKRVVVDGHSGKPWVND